MSTSVGKAQKERVAAHRGGIFYDLSSHQLDQIVWLLGRPVRVTPFMRNDMREVEGFTDNGVGIFEFERAIAIVDIAAMEPRPNARRFEVYGTRGSAIMDPMEPAEHIRLCLARARDGYDAGVQFVEVAPQSRQDLYALELEAFLDAIRGARPADRPWLAASSPSMSTSASPLTRRALSVASATATGALNSAPGGSASGVVAVGVVAKALAFGPIRA